MKANAATIVGRNFMLYPYVVLWVCKNVVAVEVTWKSGQRRPIEDLGSDIKTL